MNAKKTRYLFSYSYVLVLERIESAERFSRQSLHAKISAGMPMSRKNASAGLDIVVTPFIYSQPESCHCLFTKSQDTLQICLYPVKTIYLGNCPANSLHTKTSGYVSVSSVQCARQLGSYCHSWLADCAFPMDRHTFSVATQRKTSTPVLRT